MNDHHTHRIACLLRARLLDYITGALSGLALAAFYIGTVPALIAAAAFILAAAVVFAVQAVRAVHINQIFREEIGGPSPHKGLGPKDFAMDLRVYPTTRTDDTEPGETR